MSDNRRDIINEKPVRGGANTVRSNQDSRKKVRINREIRAPKVRLFNQQHEQLGIVSLTEALRLAEEAEIKLQTRLDLVEIAPNADPPVCQIMNYSKYLFELNKKKVIQKKKQKKTKLKEVKFRPVTDKNDYMVKLRSMINFLEESDKVKISIRFRGREIEHQDLGLALMQKLELDLASYANVESAAKMEGRQLIMVVGPKKKIKQGP